jgi:hypothetical protein
MNIDLNDYPEPTVYKSVITNYIVKLGIIIPKYYILLEKLLSLRFSI